MVALTLGEAATLVLARASGRAGSPGPDSGGRNRPVRRGSTEAGSFEDMFFSVPADGECDRMLRAAREALDTGRRLKRAARAEGRVLDRSEGALAALTAGAVRVFEEICTLARLNRGRVYPSYDRLAAATALGRATVARALHLLEAAGFLTRRRRYMKLPGEGTSLRYAQTSNVYRPTLPGTLRRIMPRWRRPAPIPDDMLQHRADQADGLALMREQSSCLDLARATLDGALGHVFARLGAALDAQARRESQKAPEPNPQIDRTDVTPGLRTGSAPRHDLCHPAERRPYDTPQRQRSERMLNDGRSCRR